MSNQYLNVIALLLIPVLCGCQESKPQAASAEPSGATTTPQDEPVGLWNVNSNADGLVFDRPMPGASLYEIINALNLSQTGGSADGPPRPILVLSKIEDGVAFVSIHNAYVFTQQMGTAGGQGFMATTVYSLTSVPGIEAVELDFSEGDHGSPGRYRRGDFSYFNM